MWHRQKHVSTKHFLYFLWWISSLFSQYVRILDSDCFSCTADTDSVINIADYATKVTIDKSNGDTAVATSFYVYHSATAYPIVSTSYAQYIKFNVSDTVGKFWLLSDQTYYIRAKQGTYDDVVVSKAITGVSQTIDDLYANVNVIWPTDNGFNPSTVYYLFNGAAFKTVSSGSFTSGSNTQWPLFRSLYDTANNKWKVQMKHYRS